MTTTKLTPKLWKELAKLAAIEKRAFVRYEADFGTLVPLEDAGMIVPLGPKAVAEIAIGVRIEIEDKTRAAHRMLDQDDFAAVKSLMSDITYLRDVIAPQEDGEAIWFAVTDAGRAALAAHEARKRVPCTYCGKAVTGKQRAVYAGYESDAVCAGCDRSLHAEDAAR